MRFTIRVRQPFPALGLHPENLVTVEPGAQAPWHSVYLHRPLPSNYGLIVALLEDGVGELLIPSQTVAELAKAVGWPLSNRPGRREPDGHRKAPSLLPRAHLLLER